MTLLKQLNIDSLKNRLLLARKEDHKHIIIVAKKSYEKARMRRRKLRV